MASRSLTVLMMAGLAACGSDTDSAPEETTAAVTDSATIDSVVTEPVVAAPATTEAAVTESIDEAPAGTDDSIPATEPDTDDPGTESNTESDTESDAAIEPAAPIEFTPELETFAEENSELLNDWATQLTTFGTEAIDNLGDVSAAPSAPRLLELSDEVVATIGSDTTDAGLVTARDFAAGVSTAISQSIDGDQDGALTTFFELQEQADGLTEALNQFGN